MPGSVIDLAVPGASIPDPIVVDTNMLAERLIVPYLGSLPTMPAVDAVRADQLFIEQLQPGSTALVPPTVFNEFVHVAWIMTPGLPAAVTR